MQCWPVGLAHVSDGETEVQGGKELTPGHTEFVPEAAPT